MFKKIKSFACSHTAMWFGGWGHSLNPHVLTLKGEVITAVESCRVENQTLRQMNSHTP